MGRRPFQDYDPDDPYTWDDNPVPPAPWDKRRQARSWPSSAASFMPQTFGGFAAGLMQLPAMASPSGTTNAVRNAAPQPSGPTPEQALKSLRMYNARMAYERQFGSPGPWGSAASVTQDSAGLLRRIREAREQGWPYR
jgi:hypothetical protein